MNNTNLSTNQQRLLSLLAVSAGALALPQDGDAAIFFTDLTGNPAASVGFSAGFNGTWSATLPGGAKLSVWAVHAVPSRWSVDLGIKVGANVYVKSFHTAAVSNFGFVKMTNAGPLWGAIGTNASPFQEVGLRRTSPTVLGFPASFVQKYAAFEFQNGAATWFGWVQLSQTISTGVGPDVTVLGYAYDNTGAQIAMGATGVPEPSQTALVMGALALGAAGVRRWRSRKQAPTAS